MVSASTSATSCAARMTCACPSTLGAVKPIPMPASLFTAEPSSTARMWSPSASASARRLRTTIPTPPPRHGPGRLGVERPAVAVLRDDATLVVVARLARRVDGGAASQGHVALPGEQRLRCHVDRDQRRRARGLDGDGRSAQPELVGDPGRQEVDARRDPELEVVHRRKPITLRLESLQVTALGASAVDADRARVGAGVASGVLQRLPRALQEEPVLRIEDDRLGRRDAEERGVEVGRRSRSPRRSGHGPRVRRSGRPSATRRRRPGSPSTRRDPARRGISPTSRRQRCHLRCRALESSQRTSQPAASDAAVVRVVHVGRLRSTSPRCGAGRRRSRRRRAPGRRPGPRRRAWPPATGSPTS